MHEAVDRALRDGSLDTATARRLEELLDRPVPRPDRIPADLAERIPGIDPDCAAQLRLVRLPGRRDSLDGTCREFLEPFLASRAVTGEFTLSSTSLLEDDPAWNRALGLRAGTRQAQARLGFKPDRTSPWTRRTELRWRDAQLSLGDLEGWDEAPGLWNRPRRAAPSRSFLEGGGSSLNGAELSLASGGWDVRASGHARLGTVAAAAGLGAFGQFLSVSGGQDTAGRWNGIALRSEADFDGLAVRFQPALSRRGDAWNASSRLEFAGPSGPIAWSSWATWRREAFIQPLAAAPASAGPLRPAPLVDWAAGGMAVQLRTPTGGARASLVAAARGSEAACLLPSLDGRRDLGPGTVDLELRPWLLTSAERAPRRGGSFAQGYRFGSPSWSVKLRTEESMDTSGHEITFTPTATWMPVEAWEGRLAFRQSLVELDRSELAFAGSLKPVRTATVTSELLRRQGTLRGAEGRWYFRLEARARW